MDQELLQNKHYKDLINRLKQGKESATCRKEWICNLVFAVHLKRRRGARLLLIQTGKTTYEAYHYFRDNEYDSYVQLLDSYRDACIARNSPDMPYIAPGYHWKCSDNGSGLGHGDGKSKPGEHDIVPAFYPTVF